MDIRRMPTRFANPFRPLSAADLMPLNSMKPENPVSATILREDPAADQLALFHDGAVATHSNTRKSSLMRHKHLQRLENMVTTQSNVFAVWITVGYFEVHPWDSRDPMNINVTPLPDFAHPDGLQLGQELGIDSGEVERHRAFYIIDRSVPVVFEPGENHNVEDAILLRRFIE